MTMKNSAGTMIGTNTELKYGGPTDSLPRFSASTIKGYKVPSRTAAAAVVTNTLLTSNNVSRDTNVNLPPDCTLPARTANKASEPPTTTARNSRIKTPRLGSVAKAWTEVKTPERTRNVPSRLSENAMMASMMVQFLNRPRFSVTASEWISAVPTSQGRNEAFSTGSQNHQPPQPST